MRGFDERRALEQDQHEAYQGVPGATTRWDRRPAVPAAARTTAKDVNEQRSERFDNDTRLELVEVKLERVPHPSRRGI